MIPSFSGQDDQPHDIRTSASQSRECFIYLGKRISARYGRLKTQPSTSYQLDQIGDITFVHSKRTQQAVLATYKIEHRR